jgi:hypothetical protein
MSIYRVHPLHGEFAYNRYVRTRYLRQRLPVTEMAKLHRIARLLYYAESD